MATRITRWSPDTCGCVVDYEWDDAVSEDDRVHTHHASHNICPDHADIAAGPGHHDVLIRENQSKNQMHGWLLEHVPGITKKGEGDGLTLNDGVEFQWSFSGKGTSRRLTVGIAGASLNAQDKARFRAHAATLPIDIVV